MSFSAYVRYEVELGGVGISSKPSYYPANDPHVPNEPIYATQTAIFRLASVPMRSPRSVRSTPLPFMPGSNENVHSHKLAGRFVHPRNAPGQGKRLPPSDVIERVRDKMEMWDSGDISLDELWGVDEICGACNGSKRYLIGVLGGWGNCPGVTGLGDEFEVKREKGRGFRVVWRKFVKRPRKVEEQWGDVRQQTKPSLGGW